MVCHRTRRRRFLHGTAVVLGGAIAGCTGGGSSGGGGSDSTDAPDPENVDEDATVTVGAGGENVYDPESLEIDPGATVMFLWESGEHTIIVDSQPDEASWGGVSSVEGEGFVHVHTFEIEGRYEYYDVANQGMRANILVGDVEAEQTETPEQTDSGSPYVSIVINDVDPDSDEMILKHAGGDELTASEITLVVTIEGEEIINSPLHEATDDLDEGSTLSRPDTVTIPLDSDVSEGDEVGITLIHEPSGETIAQTNYRRW